MATTNIGGIDFGTSNSSVGCFEHGQAKLIRFGDDGIAVPSAIFYPTDSTITAFGKQAVLQYRSGEEGRLLRSLKSVLGSSLMSEKTTIRNKRVPFTDIIQDFFQYLQTTLVNSTENTVESVVVGRPVHFVDDDEKKDRGAQDQLKTIATKAGFKFVDFQFEPIAAALSYESTLSKEELALVVDIGGGTADFTVIRLSPERRRQAVRTDDILSTVGIHIGGTDFDRLLSLRSVMPLLGMGSGVKATERLLPGSLYFDLATWHRIPLLYNAATLLSIKQMKMDAKEPELVQRLYDVVEGQYGHELAGAVEQVKIHLSDAENALFELTTVADGLQGDVPRGEFEASVAQAIDKLVECVSTGLTGAGVESSAITSVFYTGGSSSVPLLQKRIADVFPDAKHVRGDTFGSVGLGLTIDAASKFA
ncbi:MAG: Hsp70 family protein [Granulosicoccus sp.]